MEEGQVRILESQSHTISSRRCDTVSGLGFSPLLEGVTGCRSLRLQGFRVQGRGHLEFQSFRTLGCRVQGRGFNGLGFRGFLQGVYRASDGC